MKYLQEFRDRADAAVLAGKLKSLPLRRAVTLMEVCGSHTMAIHKYGLRQLLPPGVRLISGPGCPVCVTGMHYVDQAIAIGRMPGVILTTFGDMMKVPGHGSTLNQERAAGCDVRVVYSTLDALAVARENPDRPVVFLGIGFETTAPTVAAAIHQAAREGLANFSVLVAHKLIPPAMAALAGDPAVNVHGYLCPAHVSAIIGTRAYESLPERHGVACVVVGFEPLDILQGVYQLLGQVIRGEFRVENEYSRVVRPEGNLTAQRLLADTFETIDDHWRGIGAIAGSGLRLLPGLAAFDAATRFPVQVAPAGEPKGCICGDILRGIRNPDLRWKLDPEDSLRFGHRQARLLQAAARLVAPGGDLGYVTCSAEPEENQAVAAGFLREQGDRFRPVSPRPLCPELLTPEGHFQSFPAATRGEGFFCAFFHRI